MTIMRSESPSERVARLFYQHYQAIAVEQGEPGVPWHPKVLEATFKALLEDQLCPLTMVIRA